jgi:hypothetical protein
VTLADHARANAMGVKLSTSLPGIARRKTRVNALITRQSIHLRNNLLAKEMDARVKPAHDWLNKSLKLTAMRANGRRGMPWR